MNNDQIFYNNYAHICKAIVHPVRQQIISFLADAEKSVTEIQQRLDIPMSNISNHLNALYHVGVVRRRKQGNYIYYFLTEPALVNALAKMKEVIVAMVTQVNRDMADFSTPATIAAGQAVEP